MPVLYWENDILPVGPTDSEGNVMYVIHLRRLACDVTVGADLGASQRRFSKLIRTQHNSLQVSTSAAVCDADDPGPGFCTLVLEFATFQSHAFNVTVQPQSR